MPDTIVTLMIEALVPWKAWQHSSNLRSSPIHILYYILPSSDPQPSCSPPPRRRLVGVMSSQRDPFQHRPPDAKTQVMKQILGEINSVLKRPEKPEKSFICGQDLRSIWATSSARIVTLLQPDQLSPDQIHVIQLRMIMILSTLVSIGAMDCLANFRSRFFDPNSGAPLLTDDDMPFTMEQLTFLDGGSALSQLFYQRQFQFTPVVIEFTKNQRIQLIENRMARLPFIYSEQDIGEGSYGKVDRVKIPPGYIKGESGWVRDRVSAHFQ